MKFFEAEDPPKTDGRYLVYSDLCGFSFMADYSTKRAKWIIGSGMSAEEVHVDFWTFMPIPRDGLLEELRGRKARSSQPKKS